DRSGDLNRTRLESTSTKSHASEERPPTGLPHRRHRSLVSWLAMELLLIRHARPVRAEKANGPADPVLSEIGRRQAASLADWLADEAIDAVYTSPLRRAVETALPVARSLGVTAVPEPALSEYDADAPAYIP